MPPGSYASAAIILLTDGQRTTGPDPLEAAKLAADRGVRVFTVGVGTPQGEVIGFEGWSMRVRLDEDTLKKIAGITHGEYFYAGTAVDLKKVYETLNTKLVLETRQVLVENRPDPGRNQPVSLIVHPSDPPTCPAGRAVLSNNGS